MTYDEQWLREWAADEAEYPPKRFREEVGELFADLDAARAYTAKLEAALATADRAAEALIRERDEAERDADAARAEVERLRAVGDVWLAMAPNQRHSVHLAHTRLGDALAALDAAAGAEPTSEPGCDGCRVLGPLLAAPGTSGRSWKCGTCGMVWSHAPADTNREGWLGG